MKQQIEDRVDQNIARVRNLVNIYISTLAGGGRGRRGHAKTDVLRAGTVLLHASVEDCLRSLAYWKMSQAAPAVLDKMPLSAAAPAMKYSLGALAAYRGKTIDEVLQESVDAFLERSNYNNTTEVSAQLQDLGVNIALVNQFFPKLEEMMRRRHQIVHRADHDATGGRGHHAVRSIGSRIINLWIDNAEGFCRAVLNQFP